MKQKLALCCALIHNPKILFLDEPTTGVDTVSRKEFWDMLKRLKNQGITILVSTPYMDEATLCERIALIQKGSILSVETPENIIRSYNEKLYAIKSSQMYQLLTELRNIDGIKSANSFGEFHHISFKETYQPEQLMRDLENKGISDLKIHEIEPTIEDCFIKLMH